MDGIHGQMPGRQIVIALQDILSIDIETIDVPSVILDISRLGDFYAGEAFQDIGKNPVLLVLERGDQISDRITNLLHLMRSHAGCSDGERRRLKPDMILILKGTNKGALAETKQ